MEQMIHTLDNYKDYLERAISYYFHDDDFQKYFKRVPLTRYHTFKYCFQHFVNNNFSTIIELGTSRSFVDGRFEGCNLNDAMYWDANDPSKWDWSAGIFTRLAPLCLKHVPNFNLRTVDLNEEHIQRSKHMNSDLTNIHYYISSSEEYLRNFVGKIDFLYIDTGDMTPIENTAQLHLQEAKIIVERNLINIHGIILIDDVRSCVPFEHGETIDMGKGYLSIPYFLQNGFKLVMDEYQTVLIKIEEPMLNIERPLTTSPKVLHISFHRGCQNDVAYVAKQLNLDLYFMEFNDGSGQRHGIYNVGYNRAAGCWNKYKDYFNSFDIIITSDTAPISRVFLQNKYKQKLIIWVCNRFDYCDTASNDCGFPDTDYYELIKSAKNKKNVFIAGYTPFENYYAKYIKNVDIGDIVIKPIGKISEVYSNYTETNIENKTKLFFVPPYHNDKQLMDLSKKLTELHIPNYCGRYNGPLDLKEYKGIIHIPYAWSNLALFEGIQLGIVYFVPSKNFLLELSESGDFFWSPPFKPELLELSEWFCLEHSQIILYFDSWSELQHKCANTNYVEQKKKIIQFSIAHEEKQLALWKKILFDPIG